MTTKIDTSELYDIEDLALGKRHIKQMTGTAQAAMLNKDAYKTWYNFLHEIALSRFKWNGMPPEIDTRALEYILLHYGCGGFFSMSAETHMWAFCPATPISKLNLYYNPNKVLLQPPNGDTPWYRHAYYYVKNKIMYKPNAVLCWDNKARYSVMPTIRYYARRLAAMDRTVDTNIIAQQTPMIITSDPDCKRDAEQLALQITGHASVVHVTNRLADNVGVSVLNVDAPYIADKVLVDMQKILNQYFNALGIDNSNTEKRERMIDAEATANNEQVMLVRSGALEMRKKFAIGVAELTDGEYTPTCEYAVPYRIDGSVDLGGN